MTDPAWPAPLPFLPRSQAPRCDRRDCLMLLERERLLAAALAVRGIARAWDSGLFAGGPPVDGSPPFEREVLALIGATEGLAAERIAEADTAVQSAMQARRDIDVETADRLRPVDELVADFGLTGLGRMILMLIAAPRIWGEIAQLYTILANGPHGGARPTVDEHLVRALLGARVNPHDLATELDPDQPLVRAGLVHADATIARPFAGYTIDPIVVHRLRGDVLEHDPDGDIDVTTEPTPLAALRLTPPIAAALRAWSSRAPDGPARLVLRGRPGSGRRTLLAALAGAAHRRLGMIRADQLLDQDRGATALRRAIERCRLAGWIPCIDGIDHIAAEDHLTRDRLRHVLDGFPGPLALRLGSEERAPLEPGYTQLDLLDLSESERLVVWRTELAARGLDRGDTAALAARWRIGPGTIHRVVAKLDPADLGTAGGPAPIAASADPIAALTDSTVDAGALADSTESTHDAADRSPRTLDRARATAAIDRAVSQHLERRLGDVAERVRTLPRLADMVLPSDILDSLTEFLARTRYHRVVFEEWGMARVATTSRGLTALFEGPPGTGKTMVAGALARELGLDLYRVDLSRVMSKWIGETERNLGSVFAAAEEGQAIVLFDEADSLFTKRTEVKSSNDRFANLEVNYLLQRLDSFLGIAILTTNLGTAIDAAFKRRLSFRVTFPIPDEDQREQLWRVHLPPDLPSTGALDLEELARKYQLTGGSIRNCAVRAAFLAAAESAPLSQDHLRRAVRLEYRAAGKLSEGGPIE